MMCERSGKLLALREEGALSPREARQLAGHLEGCGRCRALQQELARSGRWIESAPPPPWTEQEFAEMRRGVWRSIEARGLDTRRGASASRALGFAATGLTAAVLGMLWLVRRAPEPAPARPAPPAAAHLAVPLPEPSSTDTTLRPAVPRVASAVSPAPAARVVRAARRRAARAGEPAFSRVEFRTANPNVRVIWLVEKGRQDSSVPTAGRKQEVS